jgi:hypothetical protein
MGYLALVCADEITFKISIGPNRVMASVDIEVKYDIHRIGHDLTYPIQKGIIQKPVHLKDDLRKVLPL